MHVTNPATREGITSDALDPVTCADVDPELRALFGRVDASSAHAGWSATELRNENEHSVVVHLAFGAFSALFMGDLERQGIEDLLNQTRPALLDVDLLQVGHHGSSNATTEPLLRALTPVTAVIPMGPAAREASWSAFAYGHPRRDVVALLAAHVSGRVVPRRVMVASGTRAFEPLELDAAIYATGWDGDVVIRALPDGTHERVEVASPGP